MVEYVDLDGAWVWGALTEIDMLHIFGHQQLMRLNKM